MPIQSADIKLIKSAVLADTNDGGGPMSGVPLVSGMSNNLFPDISDTDRELGRVQMRKVFGVAQSADTDTLLGAHAVITKPPHDLNVIATLFKTDGWSDTRTDAVKNVEGYLVQGSRMPSLRIMDTHYKRSTQLRLYIVGAGSFPTAGEVIVLENPARIGVGDEFKQYVRVRDFSQISQIMTVVENGEAKEITVYIATYSIDQPLQFDVYGPPVCKTFGHDDIQSENYYAKVYSTSIADTARFFGIRPLAAAAEAGDHFLTVDSIFSPIVPSNISEEAVTDLTPATVVPTIIDSSYSLIEVGGAMTTHFIQLPTAATPGSFLLTIYGTGSTIATNLVDDGTGKIFVGTTQIAQIDYETGAFTYLPVDYYTIYNGNINFGGYIKYKPATLVDCDVSSTSMVITQANQGLNYVALLKPIPAKGTLKIEYVAQGRWYSITADSSGRIGGGSSAYGSGGINYATGSVSMSLGSPPDIGSQIVMSWGSNTTTLKPDAAKLPTKLGAYFDVGIDVYPANRTLSWVDLDGTNRSATVSPSGIISGDASGSFISQSEFIFEPTHYPNSAGVTLGYKTYTTDALTSVKTNLNANGWLLDVSNGAIEQGSVVLRGHWWGQGDCFITLADRSGELWGTLPNGVEQKLGTIDYATGSITLDNFTIPSVSYGFEQHTIDGWEDVGASTIGSTNGLLYQLTALPVEAHYYSSGAGGSAASMVLHPVEWRCKVPMPKSTTGMTASLIPASVCFKHASGVFFAGDSNGNLHALPLSGAGYLGEKNIGSIDQNGIVKIKKSVMPRANGYSRDNGITFVSALTNFPTLGVNSGVFRTRNFPLKPANFQIFTNDLQGSGNATGGLTGQFFGTIDYKYGVVKWSTSTLINPAQLRYNQVALLILPLAPELVGIDTARLPVDGKVPIFRKGDLVLVHNTQQFAVQSPVQKGVAYTLGRTNLSNVEVIDASGTLLPESLYTVDLAAGELTFKTGTDTSVYSYPWSIEHMISDMILCTSVDISGVLKIARALEHDYSAGTSYVSSLLVFGDLFARAFGDFAQQAWTSVWSDSRIGSEILANYNAALYPIIVTNTGAIRERWSLIFTSTTAYRIVGEDSGQIGTGTTTADCSPTNPATGVPYFTIRAAGFGAGWSTGNVLRFNTDTAGNPFWILRTTLQGQAQADNDVFRVAFRGSVNRV